MKIAIDGIRLSRKPSGVTFLLISLVKQLAIQLPHATIHVILRDTIHPIVGNAFSEPNVFFEIRPTKFLNKYSLFWSLFKFNRVINQLQPDFVITTNTLVSPFFFAKHIKYIVFVNDMVFKVWPNTMHFINKVLMNLFFKFSIQKAHLIWCISNYTRNELVKYYPFTLNKPIFVGCGLNEDFKEALMVQDRKASSYIYTSRPFLLFVGTLEPRKNISYLIELYNRVKEEYSLVIVGGKGWGNVDKQVQTLIETHNLSEDHIKLIGSANLNQLINLYLNAACYVSTSINEGLGLPLLEAMACDCPVLVAHNSAMIEVAQGAGVTVKSWDFNEWQNGLNYIKNNRAKLVELGHERLDNYDWSKIVASFVNSLENYD